MDKNKICKAELVFADDRHVDHTFTETSPESTRLVYEEKERERYRAAYLQSYSNPVWSCCFGCCWKGIDLNNQPDCLQVTISRAYHHDDELHDDEKTVKRKEERILDCSQLREQESDLIC